MVGGAGYMAGKRAQQNAEHEAGQDAQIAAVQQPAAPGAPAQAAPAQPTAMSDAERIDALTKLKGLLDSGVLTQEEFAAEKAKLLPGS
jgi:hypothetical protein